jgi:hypothetical protein
MLTVLYFTIAFSVIPTGVVHSLVATTIEIPLQATPYLSN